MSNPDSLWRNVGVAATSFVLALAAAAVPRILWTRPWVPGPTGSTDWGDTFAFLLLLAGFAAIGWLIVILPIVAFGKHEGWFFDPRLAPLTGAVCGIAILLAEFAIFFDLPPWVVFGEASEDSMGILVLLAAVFGAVCWGVYARRIRRTGAVR